MDRPTFSDYINIIYELFDKFMQHHVNLAKNEIGFYYKNKLLIVFFILMQFRSISQFKTQHRWLKTHPQECKQLGFEQIPHRTTLSRRYKRLYPLLQEFVAFTGEYVEPLDEVFSHRNLFEDKSLFKAQGPVWHQADRNAGVIPEKLRNLDTDATWSKSGYHGWVYGYGLHSTCNHSAFPLLVNVETANIAESQIIEQKEDTILFNLQPDNLTTDNSYFKATRIRKWAKEGVALITPALKWIKGRYAKAYHQFIDQVENKLLFKIRKTSVEPLFDLIAKIIGTNGKQKQLFIQRLPNVRSCLALATFSLQVAMIVNNIWGLPLRNISTIKAAFS